MNISVFGGSQPKAGDMAYAEAQELGKLGVLGVQGPHFERQPFELRAVGRFRVDAALLEPTEIDIGLGGLQLGLAQGLLRHEAFFRECLVACEGGLQCLQFEVLGLDLAVQFDSRNESRWFGAQLDDDSGQKKSAA